MAIFKIIIFYFFFIKSIFAYTYTVRPKDTLSDILYNRLSGRLYGKKGHLNWLKKNVTEFQNPDQIEIGQTIDLDKLIDLLKKRKTLNSVQKLVINPLEASEILSKTKPHQVNKAQTKKKILKTSYSFSIALKAQSFKSTDTENDSNEVILSDLGPEIGLKLSQMIDKNANFYGRIFLNQLTYKASESFILKEDSQTQVNAQLGYEIHKTSFSYRLIFDLKEQLFIRFNSEDELFFSKSIIPSFNVGWNKLLYQSHNNFKFSAELLVGNHFHTTQEDYSTESGQQYGVSIYTEQDIVNSTGSLFFSYLYSKIPTSESEHISKEASLGFFLTTKI